MVLTKDEFRKLDQARGLVSAAWRLLIAVEQSLTNRGETGQAGSLEYIRRIELGKYEKSIREFVIDHAGEEKVKGIPSEGEEVEDGRPNQSGS